MGNIYGENYYSVRQRTYEHGLENRWFYDEKATIENALKLFIQIKGQQKIKKMFTTKGKAVLN